jgi:REP element-mobilizing transposase RayT
MVINPILKYHRRSIRLPRYDYSQAGAYFVTICCKNRAWAFGEVVDGTMVLNGCGEIARDEWIKTAELRANVELGEFVIMPNHVHGIIIINNDGDEKCVGAGRALPLQTIVPPPQSRFQNPGKNTLFTIVGAYKSAVSKHIHKLYGQGVPCPCDFAWQRNYYEHIIRTDADYRCIAEYIANNPAKWETDSWYVDKILAAKAADTKAN